MWESELVMNYTKLILASHHEFFKALFTQSSFYLNSSVRLGFKRKVKYVSTTKVSRANYFFIMKIEQHCQIGDMNGNAWIQIIEITPRHTWIDAQTCEL